MRLNALFVLLLAAGCGAPAAPSSSPQPFNPVSFGPPVRILMLTATAGFRHDSIETARQVLSTIAAQTGEIAVTATENLADINASQLASVDVLMFAMTSGDLPFDDQQKAAILNFVNGGGGFMGFHSATDTLYNWPEYGQLVGAYFKEHPWTQDATVRVEDTAHPSTKALGASFRIFDEFYAFRENPRPAVHVLLSLDAGSVSAQGDYPLAWTHSVGQGRSYYNALGHFQSTWNDSRFQAQVRGAIRWVARRE